MALKSAPALGPILPLPQPHAGAAAVRTNARPTRRSVLLAFLSLLFPQPRRSLATRMTIAEPWPWCWQWCRALAGPGPLAAA